MSSVYIRSEMHARLRGSLQLHVKLFTKHIEPDYPSWTDEIAKPRPDMNIKVAAFYSDQKLYYSSPHLVMNYQIRTLLNRKSVLSFYP